MAQKRTVELVDDLSGEKADETVTFGMDGRHYEIDLSGANASTLRDALAPFVAAARQSGKSGQPGRPSRSFAQVIGRRDELARVRAWAAENGIEVAGRGRIPADVMAAYKSRDAALAAS